MVAGTHPCRRSVQNRIGSVARKDGLLIEIAPTRRKQVVCINGRMQSKYLIRIDSRHAIGEDVVIAPPRAG